MKYKIAIVIIALSCGFANAQTVTINSPTIVCDSPSGVGCNGSNILKPGKYRILSTHNLGGKGSCQVSGPGGSGYVLCSAIRGTR
jgi:hypothetical protein